MSDFKGIEIGALWLKDGNLSGSFGPNARIAVIKNKYKKEEKHPDYKVYLFPQERQEGAQKPAPAKATDKRDELPF